MFYIPLYGPFMVQGLLPHDTLLNKASVVGFHQARLVENKAPCHLGRATVNILDNDVRTNKKRQTLYIQIWHYFHHLLYNIVI
jgi:hypothetical protein